MGERRRKGSHDSGGDMDLFGRQCAEFVVAQLSAECYDTVKRVTVHRAFSPYRRDEIANRAPPSGVLARQSNAVGMAALRNNISATLFEPTPDVSESHRWVTVWARKLSERK